MDELAFRTLLNNLEAFRSSLHGLLHIFTWFVVVGLAFDLIVIIREFRDDWREFRYGHIHPYENHLPKQPSISLLILGLLGTALIVIGVAGELYVDVQAGKIETQIREANDNLLGLIIREAGDAAQSAKTAHGEASAVKGIADEARADAKDALAKAQAAQGELAHAEADAAKAQAVAAAALSQAKDALDKAGKAQESLGKAESEAKNAEKAASNALSLSRDAREEADWAKDLATKAEAQLADRTLTDEQVKSIANKLEPFAGQEYEVVAYWDSKESVGIANRVHQGLQAAHWTYLPLKEWHGLFGGIVGIQVWMHPDADERVKKAATALVDALTVEGLEAVLKLQNPTNNPKHNKISLSVGSKR